MRDMQTLELLRDYLQKKASIEPARVVPQTRLEDIVSGRNPSDPFAARPEIGRDLREALRRAD